jgi:hypothetical protein
MVPDDASMGAAPPSLAKAASERMRRASRPGGGDLTGHDRADAELVEQLWGEPTDQPVELDLELGGLPLAGERPAGGGPHRHYGGGLLNASARGVAQPGAGVQQLSQRQPPEPLPKTVRGAGDQRMQRRRPTEITKRSASNTAGRGLSKPLL